MVGIVPQGGNEDMKLREMLDLVDRAPSHHRPEGRLSVWQDRVVRSRFGAVLTAALLSPAVAGCTVDDGGRINDRDATPRVSGTAEPKADGGIDKILVVVVENKGFSQMQERAENVWALAELFGYASDFRAITHPSLPNYIAMAAGDRLGVTENGYPDEYKLTAPNVFTNTLLAGGTAQTFADGMGSETCRESQNGKYVPRHNPWVYFSNDRDNCRKYVVDAAAYEPTVAAGNLANLTFLIPDNCHNAHDCAIETADKWVYKKVTAAMAGPDFRSGRLVIVVTADEDNKKEDNRILTVVIHPSLSGKVVRSRLTLYSLHRLLAQVTHTRALGKGASAPDMAAAFGLRIRPAAAAP